MTRSEKIKFLVFRSIGNFLLLFAIYGVLATFGPTVLQEVRFRIDQGRGVKYEIVSDNKTSFADIKTPEVKEKGTFKDVFAAPQNRVLIPFDTSFDVLIPKIGANAKVFANVDPSNEKEFLPLLQKGVAHAKGSVFPGSLGTVYIFAHSTDNWWDVGRYNAVFYLLKELTIGDQIVVFFENRRFNYTVSESIIADPSDVSRLTQAQSGEELLVLQTCWPPGTTWKRLFVIAKPKGL